MVSYPLRFQIEQRSSLPRPPPFRIRNPESLDFTGFSEQVWKSWRSTYKKSLKGNIGLIFYIERF